MLWFWANLNVKSEVPPVVDYIAQSHDKLLADDLIDISLQHAWDCGIIARVHPGRFLQRAMQWFDALGTPRQVANELPHLHLLMGFVEFCTS